MYYPKGARPRAFKDRYNYDPVIDECSNELSKQDRIRLNGAIRLAMESRERTKHGCIIYQAGAVQGRGVNTKRNQPGIIQEIEALSIHAEINALRRTSNLDGAVAYVSRVNSFGEPRCSRPCPDCMMALRLAGIKRVVYTISGSEYL